MRRQWRICSSRLVSPRPALMAPWIPALGGSYCSLAAPVDLKVLTSCALIGEGVDVPSVGGCILLRPTASVGLHLQMIGRCLRPQPGKTAVVLDHVGNTLRLGHHLEERDWTLDGLRKRDREAAPSVKVCPQCFATSPSTAQVCRDCGHVFAPPERRELRAG
jgi:DNA repair protein RadD